MRKGPETEERRKQDELNERERKNDRGQEFVCVCKRDEEKK